MQLASKKINGIADQLLTGKTITSTNKKYETVDLSKLVQDIVAEKRFEFKNEHRISLTVNIESGFNFNTTIPIDQTELSRIISNLVNNSIEAIENVGQVKISMALDSDFVELLILDTGKGMSSSLLKKVGRRGFSFGKIGTNSGSGLGIYHAKSLIERSNGKFEIQSEVNCGTRISVRLPIA